MAEKVPVTWEGIVVGEAEIESDGSVTVELDAKMTRIINQKNITDFSIGKTDDN